jgi:hypothetical protein
MVTAELQQIILASVQTVSVPRSRQKNGHVTGGVDERGKQQAEKKTASKSIMENLLGG